MFLADTKASEKETVRSRDRAITTDLEMLSNINDSIMAAEQGYGAMAMDAAAAAVSGVAPLALPNAVSGAAGPTTTNDDDSTMTIAQKRDGIPTDTSPVA